MHDIQMRSIQQWAAMMDKWGVQYKIITPEGQEFGVLEVAAPKKRSGSFYPVHALSNYFQPFIIGMDVGDVAVIPVGEFDLVRLRGAIAAWTCHHWGRRSASTHINVDAQHVEVLRMS